MDDIKKAPCGQVQICSSESDLSNHVRTSFVLFLTIANQKIWALEIFVFSGVQKWYKIVCETVIFQAKRLIFCYKHIFFIFVNSHELSFVIFEKKNWLIIIWKALIQKIFLP